MTDTDSLTTGNTAALMRAVFGERWTGFMPTERRVTAVLGLLTEREEIVIRLRMAGERLEDIGPLLQRVQRPKGCVLSLGVSGERVRQIQDIALRKLRHSSRALHLWPILR